MAEKVRIVIPTIGESVSEGTIGRWFFKEGDLVKKDQPVLELDSDKATMEVPASATGTLKILVPAGKTATVGSLVGEIEVTDAAPVGASTTPKGASAKTPAAAPTPVTPSPVSTVTPFKPATEVKGFGPAKRKAIREGTFTPPTTGNMFADESAREVRKPMSTIRKRIAERLIESQQSTATLTTFNEIDMSKAIEIRKKLKDSFEKKHGVKLGFMSFFAKACIEGLKAFPDVNARIEGDTIVYSDFVNLGIAVSTDRGLIVPILRDAQNLSYSELEKKILELAEKARTGKLAIPDMQGGTFTITNGGVFGSLLSTPILNPPQSGILGMHKIEHRPMAIEKDGKYSVEVRPMMYVALSYDHRIIDGATSVGFLVKVKEYLENVTEAVVS